MVQLWGFILDNGNIEQISNVLETYKEYEPQDGNVDTYIVKGVELSNIFRLE